ncbi:MAG: DNA polymerase IV [Abditibacteriota bacterium]|nr:DNA polymerase IV [Abditibacteriota bacterium]
MSTIILADMDAFFAGVEIRDNPSLKGKPVVVGADRERSVVAAASYEARKYGINSAMPIMRAKNLCPDLIIVRGDMAKYKAVSDEIFEIFTGFTDMVERVSVDECFLDITATLDRFPSALEMGAEIKRRVFEQTGLTCSVGIAPNKTLAKLASERRKPDGIFEIKPEDVADILKDLPVRELSGIGGQTTKRLADMAITTAKQLGEAPLELLVREFGVNGRNLKLMGAGRFENPVVPYYKAEEVKSFSHCHTMMTDTGDIKVIRAELMRLSEKTCARMRSYGFSARTVGIIIRYADLKYVSKNKTLPDYTSDDLTVYRAVCGLYDSMRHKTEVRLLGIALSGLTTGAPMNLFDDKKDKINETMDAINSKFGHIMTRARSLKKD